MIIKQKRALNSDFLFINLINYWYCLSKKSLPILYSKLLHKMGQEFLDIL